mmetsp:Transcript_1393/g.2635  ORF Transcript_1393/g.2635 Transcript_1393/m.2635 type:complete len:85 (+) Transcript_1393:113-367(+)|eukprot:CAMPEP_0170168314 /NCGR_PEP_ID=MMETSP0040_2-20121228/1407_1 /TAXON_ID=641309 /ORGANISM="Lotharella oceanica, Strain CCMP622" /LENGTH=84 /DNA_ID=CAMNT_0010406545 /DNA_START=118 /DNA_END=372 /DNA_ORIENTATION=-
MSDEDWVIGFVCGIVGTLLGLAFIGFVGFLFIKCGTPRPVPYNKTKIDSVASKNNKEEELKEETMGGGNQMRSVASNAKVAAEV